MTKSTKALVIVQCCPTLLYYVFVCCLQKEQSGSVGPSKGLCVDVSRRRFLADLALGFVNRRGVSATPRRADDASLVLSGFIA